MKRRPSLTVNRIYLHPDLKQELCDLYIPQIASFGQRSSGKFAFDIGIRPFGIEILDNLYISLKSSQVNRGSVLIFCVVDVHLNLFHQKLNERELTSLNCVE
jgi:hypothetical protein